MKSIRFLFSLILIEAGFILSAKSQIVINELSPSNSTTIENGIGNFDDWIEIYNKGNSAVNLQGYSLSDLQSLPLQFVFPAHTLQPDSHLVVFASGKNKTNIVDHWESAVSASNIWKFYASNPAPDTNWRNLSFNDASWPSGPGGIGFGDGDDQTIISQGRVVLMRKTFTIADTSQIVSAILSMDYDDGFVAYINGVEIARANVGIVGVRPAYNDLATLSHEAQLYQGLRPDSFIIDFAFLKSILIQGTNVFAVEVHNQTPSSNDLSSIPYLNFAMRNPGTFYSPVPSFFIAPPKEYYNANFKLSKSGETVFLFDNITQLIDSIRYTAIAADNSIGRIPDGNLSWCIINTSSPGSTNNNAICYTGYAAAPLFSLASGFYPSARFVSLSSVQSGIIRYSVNGDEPTTSSQVYSGPILMTNTTAIRARLFKPGYLPSPIVTNTYFINEDVHLPVFAINTDSLNLWDYNTGIYVLGPNAQPNYPYLGANFWQSWQKNASIEYYDKAKDKILSFDATIANFGNYSRAHPQKSLEIRLSSRYGQSSVNYPLIPDKSFITKTSDIILRNSGTDFNIVHFRDAFMERVLKRTNTGYVGTEPAVLFLNGAFWGVYTINENHDQHWMENNFGYKESEIDYIKEYGSTIEPKAGTSTYFFNTFNYVINADSSSTNFYQYIDSTWDLKNVIDYWAAETYYNNGDWIGDWTNNIKMWRPLASGGKMRYLVYDLDFGLGYDANFTENRLQKALHPTATCYSSQLFNGFLRNLRIKEEFINRYADLINTVFLPSQMLPIMHQFQDSMAYDMPKHFAKFGSNMTDWQAHINAMVNFINLRADTARGAIVNEFGLQGKVSLTLNVSPASAGRIQISTVVPDSYPWTGVYFNGNPVTITAIPNPGYTFNHWSSPFVIGTNDPRPITTYNFTSNDNITAFFTGSPVTPQIAISEINYHSSTTLNSGDWLELHNYSNSSINISGWQLKDENGYNTFLFPVGTVIPANGYLVVAADLIKFTEVYPTVTNFIGPLGYNLSNSGGQIRLLKNDGSNYLSFYFQESTPWPPSADGLGYTCELSNNTADPADGNSWFAGCLGGSPGRAFSGALATTAVVSGSTTFCVGGSVTLSAPYFPGYSYQWFRNNNPIVGANDTVYTSTVAGTFNIQINNGGCSSLSQSISVTVVTQGAAPIAIDKDRCGEGVVTLTATAPDSIYWYATPGGPIIGYGPTFTTPYLTGARSFYVQTSLMCPSPLVMVTATVSQITASPVVSDQNRCGPGNVILNATDTAQINWYNALTGGALINSGSFFVTGFIPHDTIFYVEAGTHCPSPRIPLNVSITSSPVPTITDAERCGPGSLVLSAISSDPVFWYDSYFGGNQVGSGFNYITPSLSVTTTYYAEAVGACASERVPVIATVRNIPAPPITTDSSRCGRGSVVLNAVSSGQVYWYDAPVGGNLLSINSTLNTPIINSNTTYYASSFYICESTRVPVQAFVIPLPFISLGNDTAIETGTTLILDAGLHDQYLWSTGETSQSISVDSAAVYSVLVTDVNGCSISDSIGITLFVYINETNGETTQPIIFPNPGVGFFQLKIYSEQNENGLLSIIDATGKLIFKRNVGLNQGLNSEKIDLNNIASGIYYLKISTKNSIQTLKLIIE